MYLGQIVELAPKETLFAQSRHPYTRSLMAAIPRAGIRKTERSLPSGDAPNPIDLPQGCRFHTRCPYVVDICRREAPPLAPFAAGHLTACHRAFELPPLLHAEAAAVSPIAEKRMALYAEARQRSGVSIANSKASAPR
ncbi:MAG: oligopeptide/dipeptide ABC transporter ATP-binding protein [Pseudorhodoplanes sp.]|uniref:oligopeptide/dipeptide ABC transporter ATP-binding protein n=1 Tax=Pseudorhodoplanes sp. TaxID=1934341 RepID=UPI003D0CB653